MNPKPTRFATWLLGSLCALAAASCTGEQEDPAPALVGVRYVQTQCADRWGPAPGTQQLVAAALTYLAQQGLTLHQPQASVKNAGFVCSACPCPTGLVLEGTMQPADLPAALARASPNSSPRASHPFPLLFGPWLLQNSARPPKARFLRAKPSEKGR